MSGSLSGGLPLVGPARGDGEACLCRARNRAGWVSWASSLGGHVSPKAGPGSSANVIAERWTGPCGPNAPTGSSSTANATYVGYWPSMSATTTTTALIGHKTGDHQNRPQR
jgi:hypothetical protein